MIELFKNPKLDWIGAKKYFIGLTIFLLIVGAIAVQLTGFNLGVDFTGGTLMTVRFKKPPELDKVRNDLASVGIDTSKVTIQTDTASPDTLLIRAPQLGNEAEQRVDQDKRTIVRALQKLNPEAGNSVGKVNINTITAEGIEQELRQEDPFGISKQNYGGGHPYRQVGDRIVSFRDGEQKGFIQDISAIQNLDISVTAPGLTNYDQAKVKTALLNRFFAGKIDLNISGSGEIEDALGRINPLGLRGTEASDIYKKSAEGIVKYRTEQRGVIGSLDLISQQDIKPALIEKMAPYFTAGSWAVISAEVVGPQVGQDLRDRAIYVTLAALAGMLIYIAFRFEWIYGIGAVLAVFHDVLITLGLFSLFKWEISLTVVAALLTLIGYSMNDTIVIFDRIRENLRLRRRDNLAQITNDSINQTLSRTVITSGLTFVSVLAIVLFGGEVLRGFGLALTIGIIIGTYSSIAVASPIMLWWHYLIGPKGSGGR